MMTEKQTRWNLFLGYRETQLDLAHHGLLGGDGGFGENKKRQIRIYRFLNGFLRGYRKPLVVVDGY